MPLGPTSNEATLDSSFLYYGFIHARGLVCSSFHVPQLSLDVGWVQHDSHRGTEGLGRQVSLEVGSDNTVVTVGSGDLTPDDSDLGTSDFLLGSVDVGNSLTQVESGVLGGADTLDLDQRRAWVVHVLGTLVGQVLTLNVQSVRFSHGVIRWLRLVERNLQKLFRLVEKFSRYCRGQVLIVIYALTSPYNLPAQAPACAHPSTTSPVSAGHVRGFSPIGEHVIFPDNQKQP